MTAENIIAMHRVRTEADKLRLACVAATGTSALLHVAYDRQIVHNLPCDQVALMGRLDRIK